MSADQDPDGPACPACAGSDVAVAGEVEGYQRGTTFRILECASCGSQFAADPVVPDDLYDVIYERGAVLPGYHRYYGYAEAAGGLRWPLRYLAGSEEMYWGVDQVLRRRKRAGASTRLLEVGAGLGYLTAAARKAGYEAEGIDLSTRAVTDARARYGPWYEVGDAADVQRSEHPYDVVVALELIEHLPDPLGFLAPQVAALPPGGTIVLSTPNKSRHPDGSLWQSELPPVHLHWFTEAGFRALVERAGGTVEFLDLAPYNEIAAHQAAPTDADAPPPTPVLDEDLEPLQRRPTPGFPSVRDRALRYPLMAPVAKLARRARSGGPRQVDSRANSFVAIVRAAGPDAREGS